jgi:hypothetical protein
MDFFCAIFDINVNNHVKERFANCTLQLLIIAYSSKMYEKKQFATLIGVAVLD